jgi:hypothetical protein
MEDPQTKAEEILNQNLPTDKAVMDEYFGLQSGPEGVYLEPAIAGFVATDSINESRFLTRESIFDTFDVLSIERPKLRVVRQAGKLAAAPSAESPGEQPTQ